MKVMSINKINYEQFALDYLEGNLSGNTLKEMELFLSENADIKKELEELELFYLEEEEVIYNGKEYLLKETPVVVLGNKSNSSIIKRIMRTAAALLLFVMLSVLFIFNNNNNLEKNSIINIAYNKIENRIDGIINSNPKNQGIIIREEIIDNNSITENTVEENIIPKRIKEYIPSSTVQVTDRNLNTIKGNTTSNTIKNTDIIPNPTLELTNQDIIELKPEIASIKLSPVTKKEIPNILTSSIPPIETNRLSPIDGIISKEASFEIENEKGLMARLENLGLVPEGGRSFKLRDVIVPEGFASRN